jgi:hypothetical protein
MIRKSGNRFSEKIMLHQEASPLVPKGFCFAPALNISAAYPE